MTINKEFLVGLFEKAKESERLRMNYDLRTSEFDGSQRMLNALLPGTEVAIHRHTRSSENIICLCGRMDVILLKEEKEHVQLDNAPEMGIDAQDVMCRNVLVESERIHLCPENATFGCVVPMGTWHTVQVYEPSVIYEAKDGKYGEDGSEIYNGELVTPTNAASSDSFHNYLGDLKKNIEYLMGKECAEGNTEPISPNYISRLLNVPMEDVEKCMKEMGI
ncbi:MAG: WbuC family cupin fold metalloprotein [Bacteroidales bacterium]|nr:WbuC family cupin fold metalloprotein [Bacteroidales bacterium]